MADPAGPEPASPPRRVLVALNPGSGRTGPKLIAAARLRIAARGAPALELLAPEAETAEELIRRCREIAARQQLDAIVVVGGDGMVQLGVELVAGTRIPLGIVPAGSGNDFARTMQIPRRNPLEALEAILRGLEHPEASLRAIDAIRIRREGRVRWAANSVNIGFDARVNRRANELGARRARYLRALIETIPSYRALPFRIGINGARSTLMSRGLVAVCNGRSVGGGIKLTPDADVADGLLDVMMVRPVASKQIAMLFPLALRGLHTRLPWVEMRKVRSIEIDVPRGVPIYADGEELGEGGHLAIEVVPAAWRLLRGAGKVEPPG